MPRAKRAVIRTSTDAEDADLVAFMRRGFERDGFVCQVHPKGHPRGMGEEGQCRWIHSDALHEL